MTVCVVLDSNNQKVNMIVAEPTDLPPEGCILVEVPEGMYWDDALNMLQTIPVAAIEVPEEP